MVCQIILRGKKIYEGRAGRTPSIPGEECRWWFDNLKKGRRDAGDPRGRNAGGGLIISRRAGGTPAIPGGRVCMTLVFPGMWTETSAIR